VCPSPRAATGDTTGVTLSIRSGPWTAEEVAGFLDRTVIPIRLASTGRDGPLVQSLWFTYRAPELWCATRSTSVLVRRLRRDPRVGWEVAADAPPYRGVRGTGRVIVEADAGPTLSALIDRYGQSGTPLAAWLLARVADEVALRVTDLAIASWDYTPRMGSTGDT